MGDSSSNRIELVVRIGDRVEDHDGDYTDQAVQVKVPARFSPDGRRILAETGPGGWFGHAAILAERVAGVWVSRLEWPLTITAERDGDRWFPVRDGAIGVARRDDRGRRPQGRGVRW